MAVYVVLVHAMGCLFRAVLSMYFPACHILLFAVLLVSLWCRCCHCFFLAAVSCSSLPVALPHRTVRWYGFQLSPAGWFVKPSWILLPIVSVVDLMLRCITDASCFLFIITNACNCATCGRMQPHTTRIQLNTHAAEHTTSYAPCQGLHKRFHMSFCPPRCDHLRPMDTAA